MLEQQQRPPINEPSPWSRSDRPFEGGPRQMEGRKPNTKSILDKLRRVESDQAKKYRQRSGQ